MQYHILISRVNPSLKIDLVRFCTVKDGQAVTFTADEFSDFCAKEHFEFLKDVIVKSDISDSMYIMHDQVFDLIKDLADFGFTSFDYFDNNLVIVLDYGTETKKEER